MKEKPVRRALKVAAVVMLAVCGCDSGVGTNTNGSIRGTVTDNAGATVANAAVELTGNSQAARTTSSGPDGVYTFASVPAGTYTLTVTPPAGFTTGATGTTSVTVASGAQANAPAIVLNGTSTNGSIRGTVTDNAGATVADAAVALTGNGQAARTTSSGPDGVYTFASVPVGTYTLTVTPPAGYTVGAADTASVTVASQAQAEAPAIVLYSCAVVRPDFGGPATAEDLALFAYDVNAPLNLEQTVQSNQNGVQVSTISFDSPDGGRVPGILVEPIGRPGLRPGIVFLHTAPSPSAQFSPYLQMFAQAGAVVIAIDAPYFRRGGQGYPLFTSQDRLEQIQLMKDLQRAVDILTARADVDDERIAFLGTSYGGIMGAQFVGIERRLKAALLSTAHGGQVTHYFTPSNLPVLSALSCAQRNAWLRVMTPIEPIRYIPHASPTALLFQIARLDTAVPLADAQALYDAAPSPKEARYYDVGHGLNLQALNDRHDWLHAMIGIDPR